ncbi:MAG TPA: hypothetical protein PKE64_00185 [Anaerolineae bacterium]|nr:hypothetical protein [Anaerolineae bacterium]HMR62403.1 hypothetical protein [Anaerolineae bacterium]
MSSKLEYVLDECLTQLANGETTVEECLSRHPEYARDLHHLLKAASWLQQGREVHPTPVFKARARAKLSTHMRNHPRRHTARGLFSFPMLLGRTLNLAVGLAAVLILFVSTGTVLAQSALPGSALYQWKLASEQALRQVHPDPLTVDLLIAQRRANDLRQVVGNPEGEAMALAGYEQTLAQLATYTLPQDQQRIHEALSRQQASLGQAQVVVPELEQFLEVDPTPTALIPVLPPTVQPELGFNLQAVDFEARQITYNFVITNSGAAPTEAELVSELSPEEMLVSTDGGDCTLTDGRLVCQVADLEAQTQHNLSIITEVDRCFAGTITNRVLLEAGDSRLTSAREIVTNTPITKSYPTPGQLAVVWNDMNNHRLGLATSKANVITDQLHLRASAPAWSPNGNKLAFFGVEGISELKGVYSQGNGVYVVDVLGSKAVNPKLLMAQDHIKNIAWSPNGHYLAVEVTIPSVPSEVVVLDADNGQQLSRFLGEQPAWSPDSRELVIKACRGTCGLWLVNISGQSVKALTYNGTDSFPVWSPTDNLIAFSSQSRDNNWEIYLLDISSEQIERVTNRPASDTVPVFGPCGQEIYLLTDDQSSTWKLTALRLDGSNEYLVVRDLGRTNDWGIARPAIR